METESGTVQKGDVDSFVNSLEVRKATSMGVMVLGLAVHW